MYRKVMEDFVDLGLVGKFNFKITRIFLDT